jgi:LAS superfamily LD-carboxypeptidase LdcB
MHPDVAEAFDRMAAAARRDELSLVIKPGFRSDSEQAELFEQNPDPTCVALPGKSLHRCATELAASASTRTAAQTSATFRAVVVLIGEPV